MKSLVWKNLLSLVLTASMSLTAAAATPENPQLVLDINETLGSNEDPRELVPFDAERIIFLYGQANVAVSDGTPEGTSVAARTSHRNGRSLQSLQDGRAVFVAKPEQSTYDYPPRLWSTDGTELGTWPVATTHLGRPPVISNGKAYFLDVSQQQNQKCAIWESDGTLLGSRVVSELPSDLYPCPSALTILDSTFYMFDDGGLTKGGLWKSNGTIAGTTIVKDGFNGHPEIVKLGTRILFMLWTASTRFELWSADESGASLVKSFTSPSGRAEVGVKVVAGTAYFAIRFGSFEGFELWKTDGTPSGTQLATSVKLMSSEIAYDGGSAIYFAANEEYPIAGAIHRLDHASGTVTRLASTRAKEIRAITPLNGDLLYVAAGTDRAEFWKYDSVSGQSVMLRGFPGSEGSDPDDLLVFRGRVWFVATSATHGRELWTSDGSLAGTRQVADLAADGAASSNPSAAVSSGASGYFTATESDGAVGLWISNGTEQGTRLLTRTGDRSSTTGLAVLGSRLYFNKSAAGLWSTDGTSITREGSAFPLDGAMPAHGRLFASGFPVVSFDPTTRKSQSLPVSGRLLDAIESVWIASEYGGVFRTDGTADGTTLLCHGPTDVSLSSRLAAFMGGEVFGFGGGRMYASNGDAAGYRLVHQELPAFVRVVATPRRLFLITRDGVLWVSDGTAAGTSALSVEPLVSDGEGEITVLADSIYFEGRGHELWRSDGTSAGTRVVTGSFRVPRSMAGIDGYLYFSAESVSSGRELWQLEPATGSTRLYEIEPGPDSSNPRRFIGLENRILFSATTSELGTEPWSLPAGDSPSISIANTWATEGASAIVQVSLSRPATQSIRVGYRAVTQTASAVADFSPVEGALEFLPGEREKQIVVPVVDDDAPEAYEAFSIVLTSTQRLHRESATVVIPPSDPLPVDLALQFAERERGFKILVANKGQTPATDIVLSGKSTTPLFSVSGSGCGISSGKGCSIPLLRPGETAEFSGNFYTPLGPVTISAPNSILTVAAFARGARDLTPADNVMSLTGHEASLIFTEDQFVPLGGQTIGHVWKLGTGKVVKLASSDSTIASVPAQIEILDGSELGTFPIKGGSHSGTITITATYENGTSKSIALPVMAPQLSPRTPPPIRVVTESGGVVGQPIVLRVEVGVKGPSAVPPEGEVSLQDIDWVIARALLVNGVARFHLTRPVGSFRSQVNYAGDDLYLPVTSDYHWLTIKKNDPLVEYTVRPVYDPRSPVDITFRVLGGPLQTPTGTIELRDAAGVVARAALVPGVAAGEAIAHVSLTSLIEGTHLFEASYSGDANHEVVELDLSASVQDRHRTRGARR